MWLTKGVKSNLLDLRRRFLLFLPTVDYTRRVSSDNNYKIDKLLSILDIITNSVSSLRKSKETTLEALGKVKLENLFDVLGPRIENKFSFKLSILPRINLDDVRNITYDDAGNILNADLNFKIQGYIKDNIFTADYPMYIVDGYIREPEIVNYQYKRYSLNDFVDLITSDMLEVPKPIPMMQYINEKGNDLEKLYSKGDDDSESSLPTNHSWDPFKFR